MPVSPHRAVEALKIPTRAGGTAMALRLALGAVFALSVLSVPRLAAPEPVAAGSSCTGWGSTASPPETIRVLRTRSGKVEKVNFRRYVAEVMASGEWPSRLKMATLEAGALATKQYAWYYTLKGNHRSSYVSGGRCYDVRDDTLDQLYRPNRATPTDRQWRAINKTWNLTLRKNGRFFLTGYRAGGASQCAADANGWKLYARSVNACANKGWSSTRILKRYLSPNLAFVWSDTMGPLVQKPAIALKVGNVLPGAATLRWKPYSTSSDVAGYKLQRKTGQAEWKAVAVDDTTAKWVDVWLKTDVRTRFRVKARDSKGKTGPWAYSPRRKAALRGPIGTTLSGAGVETADSKPLKVKALFSGHSVAFVSQTGPGMGQAKVFVNGKRVATVDLERATTTKRKLVWTKNWSSARTRSVVVKAVDLAKRIDFDGFYILR